MLDVILLLMFVIVDKYYWTVNTFKDFYHSVNII